MKISAIDIRKHTFEKIFRGYDPEAVDAFLNSLSQEWERFVNEHNAMKLQLEYTEKELSKLKDIESTLFRTLKTAEDTGRLIEREANDSAKSLIDESKLKSNQLIEEAEARSNSVLKETEIKLNSFREQFAAEIKLQERDFRAIENFRDNLIVQLTSLANNTIETVERFDQKYDKESVLNRMEEIRKHVSEIEIPKKAPVIQNIETPEEEATAESTPIEDIPLEIIESPEAVVEEPILELEPEETTTADIEIEEPEVEETIEQEQEVVEHTEVIEPVSKKSVADEANEALMEMHKSAEEAKIATQTYTRSKVNDSPDSDVKKKNSGGSFFDQI